MIAERIQYLATIEEFGLIGARAFIEKHPWANDVGLYTWLALGAHLPSSALKLSFIASWDSYIQAI